MARWKILGLVLALGLVGCDDDGGGEDAGSGDAGPGADTDAGPAGGGPAVTAGGAPADYACRGTVTAPADGADVSFDAIAGVFGSEDVAEGLTVQFYPSNEVAVDGTCAAPCIEGMTDASGALAVTAPAEGWYGYRIQAGSATVNGTPTDFITVVQSNEPAPAADGTMVTMSAITASLRDQIVLLLGTSAEPGTATVTGTAQDCTGAPVANATVRIFDDSGEVEAGFDREGPREFYFDGDAFPRARQELTNTDGLFGIANLPIPASGSYRVEIYGSTTDGEPAELLGCETIDVVADGVTIINVGPQRSDGPAGCGG